MEGEAVVAAVVVQEVQEVPEVGVQAPDQAVRHLAAAIIALIMTDVEDIIRTIQPIGVSERKVVGVQELSLH